MKPETRAIREQEKLDRAERAELLADKKFQKFLGYICSNASKVEGYNAKPWLPSWIITGCELYFTIIDSKIKDIVRAYSEDK